MPPEFQDLRAGVWKKANVTRVGGCGIAIRKGKLTDYCYAFQLDFCQGCGPSLEGWKSGSNTYLGIHYAYIIQKIPVATS
jgi:hypothetical protein